jgi:hypothetical protein
LAALRKKLANLCHAKTNGIATSKRKDGSSRTKDQKNSTGTQPPAKCFEMKYPLKATIWGAIKTIDIFPDCPARCLRALTTIVAQLNATQNDANARRTTTIIFIKTTNYLSSRRELSSILMPMPDLTMWS